MSAVANPYHIYTKLSQAGWFRNYESHTRNLTIPVSGAPSLGSSPGGKLYTGAWTKPDGTTLFQRSNMDRSVTTIIIDPMGNITHRFISPTLIDASDALDKLNIV